MGDAFGEVRLTRGNSNLKTNGSNNRGTISNNSNVKLNSNNSTLNVSNNSNMKVSVEDTTLETSNCSNTDISGSNNEASLKSSSNSKFSGNGNKWEASNNSNISTSGDNNVVKLKDNSNAHLDGDRGEITAEDNSNLKVSGNGNKIFVKGTRNHSIRLTPAGSGLINQLEIVPNPGHSTGNGRPGLIASVFGSGSNNNSSSYKIDYVEKAVIVKETYNLGIFAFDLKNNNRTDQHVITFDEVGLDPGSILSRTVGPKEILLSATKGGVKQELRLKGPQIIESDPSTKVFLISML